MFFTVSKALWLVAEPVTFVILAGILGILLGVTRFARAARVLMASAIIALAAGLLTPTGAMLLRPLEERFPQPPADMPPPAGIIVLGGAMDTAKSEARGQLDLTSDGTRMTAGIELARRYPAARLVFTGGSRELLGEGRPEAISARQFWVSLGVPADRMTFEACSRAISSNPGLARRGCL